MRNLRTSISTLGFLIFILAPCLRAQTGDWRRVENLPSGTNIFVTLKHMHNVGVCTLLGVTDDGLVCERGGPLAFPPRKFRRDNIQAVYLEGRRTLIGSGIGATGGAVLGALRPLHGVSRGASALLGALVLGAVGTGLGAASDQMVPGKLVYRSGAPSGRGGRMDKDKDRNSDGENDRGECNSSCDSGSQGGKESPDNGAAVRDPAGPAH
jgi:hypothetical protein